MAQQGPAADPAFAGFGHVTLRSEAPFVAVYGGRDDSTGRYVALEVLQIRTAPDVALDAFDRTCATVAALAGTSGMLVVHRSLRLPDRRPVVVAESWHGSLAERVDHEGAMAPDVARTVGAAVAAGLLAAHDRGLQHGEVTPAAIRYDDTGAPALGRFGVAALMASTPVTAGRYDVGSLHVAPELLQGGAVTDATDVYGLGSTLFQLLSGRSAFAADGRDSATSVILRALRTPPPALPAGVPARLSDLVRRSLAKDPDRRPTTAEMLDVLTVRSRTVVAGPADGVAAAPADGGGERGTDWSVPSLIGRPAAAPPVLPGSAPPQPADADADADADATRVRPAYRRPAEPLVVAVPPAPPTLPGAVPVFGFGPEPAAEPTPPPFAADLTLDPASLRRRHTLRAGGSALTMDDARLVVRIRARRTEIAWAAVRSVDAQFAADGSGEGWLVAVTDRGPVELPATRRPVADLAYVYALVTAYRKRSRGR